MSAPELQNVEIEGTTRAQFIVRGALATGAVYGVGAVAPFVSGAFGASATGDLEVLSFALTLEQLETAFYKAALSRAGLTGDLQKLATAFGAQEAEHAKAISDLITQLGSKPAAAPTAKFGLTDQASFLKLAVTLEDTGIAAYNGAAPAIKTPDILSALASIAQTEARHSGALRMLAGQDPAPQAFDKGLTPPEVSAVVQPFVQQS